MKYINQIIILLPFTIIFGCTKILDKKDLTAVNDPDVWNDVKLATAYSNGIYAANLPEWETDWAGYSDESNGGSSYMYGQLTENSVNYWPYENIRNINYLLVNIDQGTISDDVKTKLKAEAFFFRAWNYFQLVVRYGGVPLLLAPQKLTDDLLVKRSATSAVMQQILNDLDAAIEGLPAFTATSGDNDGHLHKGTAMAVKGRVLLYYASPQFDPDQTQPDRWQQAYDANKAAKEYLLGKGFGLYDDFGGIWYNEMNKEDLFVRRYEYAADNPASLSHWAAATRPLDVSQGATGANRPALELVQSFPMKDGKAIDDATGAYSYKPDYYWLDRDPRFAATIVNNGSLWELSSTSGRIQWTYVGGEQNNPTITGFYCRKAVDPKQDAIAAYNSSTDWVELRFAEVLLNLAEAANEIGKTADAYTELKTIRGRAGIEPGPDDQYGLKQGMSKSEMRNAIMNERKLEFAFEGKRFWDLRRRRAFETTLNGTRRHGLNISLLVTPAQFDQLKASMSGQDLVNYLNTHYTTYFKDEVNLLDTQFDINWKPEYYFFAIPTEHLQLNSNLEQTKGWEGGTFDPLK